MEKIDLATQAIEEGTGRTVYVTYEEVINQATEELKGAYEKSNLLEAKNADACKTIADLLAQVESLQIANKNMVGHNDALQDVNRSLAIANRGLVEECSKNKALKAAILSFQICNQEQLKKIRKLKKKNKHLLRALSC